jgi:hypothetical protein
VAARETRTAKVMPTLLGDAALISNHRVGQVYVENRVHLALLVVMVRSCAHRTGPGRAGQ